MTTDEGPARPHLRIVGGNPTPEEVAVVTAVLTAVGGSEPEPRMRSLWARPAMRSALGHGAGAWRASGLPRR